MRDWDLGRGGVLFDFGESARSDLCELVSDHESNILDETHNGNHFVQHGAFGFLPQITSTSAIVSGLGKRKSQRRRKVRASPTRPWQ